MTTNMLIYLIVSLMAVETGDRPDALVAVGDHGRAVGPLQIHRVMVREVERQTGVRYHEMARYSVEGSMQIALDYFTTWRRRINGRVYTISDLTPGQCAALWGAGPGALDHRLGKKAGPYQAKVQREYDSRVREYASR